MIVDNCQRAAAPATSQEHRFGATLQDVILFSTSGSGYSMIGMPRPATTGSQASATTYRGLRIDLQWHLRCGTTEAMGLFACQGAKVTIRHVHSFLIPSL